MKITHSQVDIAIDIIREAADWLIQKGRPLWRPEDLNAEKLLSGISEENIYTGWEGDVPVAAMILIWHDPLFWPDIKPGESGFIHKLSVRRGFAGKGYAKKMIEAAEAECHKRHVNYLRLDCAGDRPKLCALYESAGFRRFGRRMHGEFDVAFYEKKLGGNTNE